MPLRDIIIFAFLNLKLRKTRTFFTILGVAIGIAALVFFLSLTAGLKEAAFKEIYKTYPATQLIVKNDYAKLGVFKAEKEVKVRMTEQIMHKFREIAGVTAADPVLFIEFPSTIKLQLFGSYFESDVPIYGLKPEVFADQPELYRKFSARDDRVPGLINSKVIDFYNSGLARSHQLPAIDPSIAEGIPFTLEIGYSVLLNSQIGEKEILNGVGVGASERVPPMGLTIPYDWAKKISAKLLQKENNEDVYDLAYLSVASPEDIGRVSKQIEEMGFKTESGFKMMQEVDNFIQNMILIFSVISLVILIVAALSIFNTISMSVITRTQEIGILRACGATKKIVYQLFLTESLQIGLIGGILGYGCGLVTSVLVNFYLLSHIPELTFKPTTFFLFPWYLLPLSLVISLLLSAISGFFPSRQAAALAPIQALTLH